MQQLLYKWCYRYTWISAGVVSLLLFIVFLSVSTPLINSGDDIFFMYTLGGGYGEPPSVLLHYNYGWNFILSVPVKKLFELAPAVNWYTVTLLLFHFAGCYCILYVLFKRYKPVVAACIFFLLFFYTETRQLLSLNYTGAAFTAAAGGMCLLIYQLQQLRKSYANIIPGIVIIIAAGLLRTHVAWLVILLFGPVAIVLLSRKQFLYWCMFGLMITVVLWAMNKQHEQYYTRHIPGWQQQEKFRQSLFYAYNRQLTDDIPAGTFKDSTEQALFFAGFLYDTAQFNTGHIQEITHSITRNRSIFNKTDRAGLYWFFIELRVYLLLLAGMILLLFLQGNSMRVKKWLLAVLAFITIHSYLFIYLKITMPLHLGLLSYLILALLLQLKNEDGLFIKTKPATMIPLLILAAASAWMGIRLTRENNINKENYTKFTCAMQELNSDPEKLMVATDDAFPINYFYIWNTPSAYPAANLMYKDRLITGTCFQTLQRFSIPYLPLSLYTNSRVYLLGRPLPALMYKQDSVVLSERLPGYQCLELRQLQKKQ